MTCCDCQARDSNTVEVNTFEEGKEKISTKKSNGHDSTIRILRWTGLFKLSMIIFIFKMETNFRIYCHSCSVTAARPLLCIHRIYILCRDFLI